MSSSSSSSSSTPTQHHSLLSLGSIVKDILETIQEIKTDIQDIRSGQSKTTVLEQTVKWIEGEIEQIVTGTPNPYTRTSSSSTSTHHPPPP